jgi:hypothetical protein
LQAFASNVSTLHGTGGHVDEHIHDEHVTRIPIQARGVGNGD